MRAFPITLLTFKFLHKIYIYVALSKNPPLTGVSGATQNPYKKTFIFVRSYILTFIIQI